MCEIQYASSASLSTYGGRQIHIEGRILNTMDNQTFQELCENHFPPQRKLTQEECEQIVSEGIALEYEELEMAAMHVRQLLVRKLGRESIFNRISELLTQSPLSIYLEGNKEQARSVAGMLEECIRDGRGMLASQVKAI